MSKNPAKICSNLKPFLTADDPAAKKDFTLSVLNLYHRRVCLSIGLVLSMFLVCMDDKV